MARGAWQPRGQPRMGVATAQDVFFSSRIAVAYHRGAMTVLSKPLYVCRPDPGGRFGPANKCSERTGDIHYWLNRAGQIIDPTPLDGLRPAGENVYIPWKTIATAALPAPNGEESAPHRCWQNVANIQHRYPTATVVAGTLARKVRTPSGPMLYQLYG